MKDSVPENSVHEDSAPYGKSQEGEELETPDERLHRLLGREPKSFNWETHNHNINALNLSDQEVDDFVQMIDEERKRNRS
ncbi:MAG: hypothetical protein ACFCU1_02415 [Sumerlaeia bacterium]